MYLKENNVKSLKEQNYNLCLQSGKRIKIEKKKFQ